MVDGDLGLSDFLGLPTGTVKSNLIGSAYISISKVIHPAGIYTGETKQPLLSRMNAH